MGNEIPLHLVEKLDEKNDRNNLTSMVVCLRAYSLMSSTQHPFDRTPRFKNGDTIVVVGPAEHKGQLGVVVQVVAHAGDFVHRYDVAFQDGSFGRYFGFELEFALSESA
jgi:hypothetical protein